MNFKHVSISKLFNDVQIRPKTILTNKIQKKKKNSKLRLEFCSNWTFKNYVVKLYKKKSESLSLSLDCTLQVHSKLYVKKLLPLVFGLTKSVKIRTSSSKNSVLFLNSRTIYINK